MLQYKVTLGSMLNRCVFNKLAKKNCLCRQKHSGSVEG